MADKIQDFLDEYGKHLQEENISLYAVIKAFNLYKKEKFIECAEFVEITRKGQQIIRNGQQAMGDIEFMLHIKNKPQDPLLDDIEVDFEQVSGVKKPVFEWTDELVAKCSRQIWQERKQSETWTTDLRAEMAVARFKRGEIVNQRLKEIVVSDRDGEITFKSGELNQLLIDVIANTNFD